MVRFYGLTPKQVRELDAHTSNQLWLAITPLEAQEIQNAMMVSAYPHLSKEKAKEISSKVNKKTKVDSGKESPATSNKDFAEFLRSKLGG